MSRNGTKAIEIVRTELASLPVRALPLIQVVSTHKNPAKLEVKDA